MCVIKVLIYLYWDLDKTTAVDALKTGLSDLLALVSHIRDTYAEDLAKKEYVEFEEIA